MLSLPSDLIAEKNKLYSGGVFIELLEIRAEELSSYIYLANNSQDVEWNGTTWSRFRFESGEFSESDEGETQSVSIRVSNISRVVQGYIESTTNGLIGDTIIYRLIHADYPYENAALTTTFKILTCVCDELWVTFTLGMENFYLRRFPAHIFSRKICRYEEFGGTACGYSGSSTSCDRTFATCISLSNSSRFGGQPGIPVGVFDV